MLSPASTERDFKINIDKQLNQINNKVSIQKHRMNNNNNYSSVSVVSQ